MTENINYMANMQTVFHQLADMNLTKKQREKIAVMIGATMVNGYAAGQAGDAEAKDTILWLSREAQK